MIYLDYAAATPMHPRVLEAMLPYFRDRFYNPSSSYLAANKIKTAVNVARARVAHWLGARPSEIIFTAGATESINLAIKGVMELFPDANMVTLGIEHDAVLATAANYDHKIVKVSLNGLVDLEDIKSQIDDKTVLVSIGYANNEIGTIQPLKEIANILEKIRADRQKSDNNLPLFLHADASQASGYLDLHASSLGVDLMTLNGGKVYGPKQTGLLYVRAGIRLKPLITGGGQELGLRSGTENVAGVVGFATALDIAQAERKESIAKISALRDELQRRLQENFPDMVVNGNSKKRLPNNLHVSWSGVDGERLVMLLDERGVMASTGSACAANKQTASHVLGAVGMEDSLLQGSLRLTLGAPTTEDEIARAADVITKAVPLCKI